MLFSTVIRCFENPVHTYPNDTSITNQLKHSTSLSLFICSLKLTIRSFNQSMVEAIDDERKKMNELQLVVKVTAS